LTGAEKLDTFISSKKACMKKNLFYRHSLFLTGMLMTILFSSCIKEPDITDTGGGPSSPLAERIIMDTAYGTHAQQKMDIYLPAGRNNRTRLVVFIHGGGWKEGDKSEMTGIINLIRQQWPEAAVANINYRLASTANSIHHNEIMNDIKAAVQFMISNKTSFAISDTLAMAGASAGAHLAMLYTYAHNPGNYVKCVGDIFGPALLNDWSWYNSFNLFVGESVSAVMTNYAGQPWNLPLYQSLSPYEVVNSSSKPTIIFHGTIDVIVPLYQSQWLNAKLNTLGVTHQYYEYPLEGHGFNPTNNLDCIRKMVAFFKTHTQ
jgi:acetyl esterase/lipase